MCYIPRRKRRPAIPKQDAVATHGEAATAPWYHLRTGQRLPTLAACAADAQTTWASLDVPGGGPGPVDPDRLSFTGTLRVLRRAIPRAQRTAPHHLTSPFLPAASD